MISIAMATYNGQNYIKEQLDSILSQTYKDFELIICDDCSKDKTPSILKEYTAKDSRITVFINDTNLGFKKNFEKAIQNCHGEYIAFCDQDDIWTPNHLEILYSQIENKDLICGNAKLIDSNGNDMNTTTHECLSSFILPESSTEQFKNLLYGNFAQGTAMMITKELAQKIIPIPQTVKYHDWWAASIASLNNGCKYTDEIVLLYRQHGTNQTVTNKYNITTAIKHAIEKKQEMKLEYQEKIKCLTEEQTLFRESVGAEDRDPERPERSVECQEQCIRVRVPEQIARKHLLESVELNLLRKEHDLVVFNEIPAADGRRYRINKGIQAAQREYRQKEEAYDLEYKLGYFQSSFHNSDLLHSVISTVIRSMPSVRSCWLRSREACRLRCSSSRRRKQRLSIRPRYRVCRKESKQRLPWCRYSDYREAVPSRSLC